MLIQENFYSDELVSIRQATQLLGISRCGYYKWKNRLDNGSPTSKDDMDTRNEIQDIAIEFPGYGYRRFTAELKNRGYSVNHKRVLRLMREDNLLCIKKTFKPVTTDSNHNFRKYPNLIKDLEITRLNQVWASGYHIHPTTQRICLPDSHPGSLQQEMYWVVAGQEHRYPADLNRPRESSGSPLE